MLLFLLVGIIENITDRTIGEIKRKLKIKHDSHYVIWRTNVGLLCVMCGELFLVFVHCMCVWRRERRGP